MVLLQNIKYVLGSYEIIHFFFSLLHDFLELLLFLVADWEGRTKNGVHHSQIRFQVITKFEEIMAFFLMFML